MSLEVWNTVASVGTFLVIAATAVPAVTIEVLRRRRPHVHEYFEYLAARVLAWSQ